MVVSFGVVTLLFALIYKYLPDAEVAWRDVWIGAAITAVLFTLGKFLLGWYLGQGSVTSAYGAAGSLVVILLWVYYTSQILLFGAEFTQAGAGPSFAVDLVRPLVDLMVLLVTLPLVQTAGRRAVAPYLALVAITAGDSLAVGARFASVVMESSSA